MVAISFSVFKDKIMSGEKTQTIRPYSEKRYKSIVKNKKLQLYWKLRTKHTEKLADAVLEDIQIIRLYAPLQLSFFDSEQTTIGCIHRWNGHKWVKVSAEEMREIAKRDGFDSISDMYYFFQKKYGKKVFGMNFMLIRWRLAPTDHNVRLLLSPFTELIYRCPKTGLVYVETFEFSDERLQSIKCKGCGETIAVVSRNIRRKGDGFDDSYDIKILYGEVSENELV